MGSYQNYPWRVMAINRTCIWSIIKENKFHLQYVYSVSILCAVWKGYGWSSTSSSRLICCGKGEGSGIRNSAVSQQREHRRNEKKTITRLNQSIFKLKLLAQSKRNFQSYRSTRAKILKKNFAKRSSKTRESKIASRIPRKTQRWYGDENGVGQDKDKSDDKFE